ncbi:MAG: fatty acid desaturase [Cytophagales bacterium]|nr:fatty acid desaturase [Cytophagales bacterium]
MLKYRADLKSVAYIIITTTLFVTLWNGYVPSPWHWVLFVAFLFMSVTVSVMSHNHNHINMWTWKPLNVLTDWWLTVFYGVPVFTWIPTHNRNHHRFNNKEGDSSLTYRKTEDNTLISLVTYPSDSGFHQLSMNVIPYMKDLWKNDRKLFFEYFTQVVVYVGWIATFMILDWQKALLYVIIPQQVSSYTVFIFNYVQHVHADEESKWNHSRNFMGVNWFLLNNGYHTIHHENAKLHWSELPEAHAKIAHNIDPSLIEPTFLGYLFRVYVLGTINPKYKTRSMRLDRIKSKQQHKEVQYA